MVLHRKSTIVSCKGVAGSLLPCTAHIAPSAPTDLSAGYGDSGGVLKRCRSKGDQDLLHCMSLFHIVSATAGPF